ncbi:MAG: GNAT family N-acetyltransferase [Fimbriimonadaceae bacterium]
MSLPLTPTEWDRWRALYAESERATPFQSPEWLGELYTRHTKGDPRPKFLAHGFAPLTSVRNGPTRSLRLAGGDYEDILCKPGDEVAAVTDLIEALEAEPGWVVANFRALREDGALLTGWNEVRDRVAAGRVMPHRPHKFVRLPTSWEEYEAFLGKKLAYKLRAAGGRRAKAFAENQLRRATRDTVDLDLDALFELHAGRWGARGESGVFVDEQARASFRSASRKLLDSDRLWLYTLWLDGKPASALYCLVDRRAVYYYIGGIDTAHQKHHPGKVLIAQAIRDAIDEGLQEFDFLGGSEAYKDDWANAERQVYRLVIGRGVLGWIAVRGFGPIDGWLRARKGRREAAKAIAWAKAEASRVDRGAGTLEP